MSNNKYKIFIQSFPEYLRILYIFPTGLCKNKITNILEHFAANSFLLHYLRHLSPNFKGFQLSPKIRVSFLKHCFKLQFLDILWHSKLINSFIFSVKIVFLLYYLQESRFSLCFNGKEPAFNVGDVGSIPGSLRYPAERNGNPLQNQPVSWTKSNFYRYT